MDRLNLHVKSKLPITNNLIVLIELSPDHGLNLIIPHSIHIHVHLSLLSCIYLEFVLYEL